MTFLLSGVVRDLLSSTAALATEVAEGPWPVAAALLALGLIELAVGARLRRPIAIIGGATVGALAATLFQDAFAWSTGLSARASCGVAAALGGGLGGAFPALFPMAAGALLGLLGAQAVAPQSQRPLALGLGAVLGVACGLVLARIIAAIGAACIGAYAVSLGLAGALEHLAVGGRISRHPAFLLATAAVLAVASFAYQLPNAWRRGAPGKGSAPPPTADTASDERAR